MLSRNKNRGSSSRNRTRRNQQDDSHHGRTSQEVDSRKHNNGQRNSFVEEHKTQSSLSSSSAGHDYYTDNNALIYSAPTVDSLGDESALIRPFVTPRQYTARTLVPIPTPSGSGSFPRHKGEYAIPINPTPSVNSDAAALAAAKGGSSMPTNKGQAIVPRKSPSRRPVTSQKDREFQIEEDSMAVYVRNIPVAERSAFDLKPLPPAVAAKKVSPSIQHLQILKRLHSVTHVRQLAFTPSVGLSSDILYQNDELLQQQRRKKKKRDGRYRSIHPVQATIKALPSNPPLLSNKKHRLPRRADVGFPNASMEEIQEKQMEIQQETEWEEASPRLIVLVTSDDLGTAVQEEFSSSQARRLHIGGLQSMPWAGVELLQAKERNNRHFSRAKEKTLSKASPNRMGMLAPPLDSTYSSTLGWRPRPFYDRSPGMVYTLVSPLHVEFEIGNIEPLVCSLSLYSFKEGFSGKASEDFWFPAGDWKGRIDIEAVKSDKGLVDMWHKRKHKAIFSYDPLVVRSKDLYLVLQVYKVTHLELAAAYLAGKKSTAELKSTDRKSWRKRLKKQFQKGKAEDADLHRTTYRATAAFDSYGTQLMSPLCYGVTALNPADRADLRWPNGQVQQNIQFFCHPSRPESQDDFMKRLRLTVARQNEYLSAGTALGSLGTLYESTKEDGSVASSTVMSLPTTMSVSDASEFSTPKKKGVRRFMSPLKSRKDGSPSRRGSSASTSGYSKSTNSIEETPPIAANIALYISALETDFLQAMLYTPPELGERLPKHPESKVLPRVLVDVSGDSSIMVDPSPHHQGSVVIGDAHAKKRSDLARIPSSRPGEHIDASEFREVLFLPPRPPKVYDVDVPPASYRSVLNLLYLYPIMLRQEPSDGTNKRNRSNKRYTIRIRLVQSLSETNEDTGIIESTNNVMQCFHNPAPWAGPTLLKSVYSRIPGLDAGHKQDELKAGVPLRDEFKMRLPQVLDGTYFLHFTLFAVEMKDDLDDASVDTTLDDGCGLSKALIAETTVPLSSSTRDSAAGVKSTTVIPNGCHRLKLGTFQLQLETRLVSSIHVSDPAVATALRDFPFASSEDPVYGSGERLRELSIVSSRSMASRQQSSSSSSVRESNHPKGSSNNAPERVSYASLFSTASGSALLGQFQPLLFMHLSNLVNVKVTHGPGPSEGFLLENISSLLEICWRIKKTCLTSGTSGARRFAAFIKETIDFFDERALHSSSIKSEDHADDEFSEAIHLEPSRSNPSVKDVESGDDDDEEFDGGAIRRRKKDSIRSGIDIKISRTFSAMESSDTMPLTRVAYGATKTDRMRLEAELGADTSRFTHLIDDDETVVTVATDLTSTNDVRLAEARDAYEKNRFAGIARTMTKEIVEDTFEDTIPASESDRSGFSGASHIDFGAYQRQLAELGLAKRVRSAAQVMLAPCVTPTLSNLFSPRDSPVNEGGEEFNHQHTETAGTEQVGPTSPQAETPTAGAAAAGASSAFSNPSSHVVSLGEAISSFANWQQPLTVNNKITVQDRTLSTQGSDVDDEADAATRRKNMSDDVASSYHTSDGTFRSPWHCPVIHFTITTHRDEGGYFLPLGRGDYLYESIIVTWLGVWVDQLRKSDVPSVEANMPRILPISIGETSKMLDPLSKFFAHTDVLLPLCLKSIVLRYGQEVRSMHPRSARVIIDQRHTTVFETFFEMLGLSLMGQCMDGLKSDDKDQALECALSASDYVVDFLIGLCTVLHPANVSVLIRKYFLILRDCETLHVEKVDDEYQFEWTKETLHRVKCSRQLRLRAVEKLAVLPNFIALNYPQRFSNRPPPARQQKPTWTKQYIDSRVEAPLKADDSLHDDEDLLPKSGWLAELLVTESLSISALSCEAVVAEAMAHIETHESGKNNPPKNNNSTSTTSSLKKRPSSEPLKREDLLMFQSIAIHAITCVHELLLRRHAMDTRYQKDSGRGRIAALFTKPVFEKSLGSVRWLARMESTHRVRSLWLLCFVYILQEAPENLIRELVHSYSHPDDGRIHRFIRLLRLGSSTFQSFIDQERHCMFPQEIDKGISPWLLQESFNTICATTIIVVDEGAAPSSIVPKEQKKMIQGILDLLLHVLTTPQSTVTHLRAVGGAIQALDKFGSERFLEIAGASLQHWVRIILSLMNSIALSVRSIAVDFVVSLFGSVFDTQGNIDELKTIFASVLPEVVAREIALCSVGGHVSTFEDVEKSVWPLRRALADIEDASPLDDDRVDPQLVPVLSVFCRASQALIDGVLIEMRLQGRDCVVVGTRLEPQPLQAYTFDADEESLFEAANFFPPETAPMQRIRWLMTLRSLHKAKGQWVEAAETLIMCARTITDSIPHLKDIWRPSRFVLWSDSRRSLWLSTVGEELGHPERGNEQVMSFADAFLEPPFFIELFADQAGAKLPQPTVFGMCKLLTAITKDAVSMYIREGGMDGLAYIRLESLLKILMGVMDEHGMTGAQTGTTRLGSIMGRKRYVEEEASLRKVLASLSGDMTKLAERLLLIVQDEPTTPTSAEAQQSKAASPREDETKPYFVRVVLCGKKTPRFLESTSLPTYVEWNTPCICRVPKPIVDAALSKTSRHPDRLEEEMCTLFGKPIRDALLKECDAESIVLLTGNNFIPSDGDGTSEVTIISIGFVSLNVPGENIGDHVSLAAVSKHFVYLKPEPFEGPAAILRNETTATFVEMTVAKPVPGPLSRQKTLFTSEFMSTK